MAKQKHSPWLIGACIVLLLLLAISYFGALSPSRYLAGSADTAYSESAALYGYNQAIADFAPEVEERKIAKTASLTSEIDRGDFATANTQLHSIIDQAEGFVLNENIREYKGAQRGEYSIKVSSDQYEGVAAQLKQLGEVTAFSENARDVTGQYINNDLELEVEQERLQRLKTLYDSRGNLEDKLRLENAIFDQERKIKYLEDALTRLDQTVVYSSLSVTLHEPPNPLVDLGFVGLGDLIKTFVESLKTLLYFIAAVLPWALLIGALWFGYQFIRNR